MGEDTCCLRPRLREQPAFVGMRWPVEDARPLAT